MPLDVLNKIEDTVLRLTGAEKLNRVDACRATPRRVEESETPLMVADCREKFSGGGLSPGGLFSLLQPIKTIPNRNKSLHIMVG